MSQQPLKNDDAPHRKFGEGALAAAGRLGLKEVAQLLKAFPDSIQIEEPGSLGTATPATVYQQQGMHKEDLRGSVYSVQQRSGDTAPDRQPSAGNGQPMPANANPNIHSLEPQPVDDHRFYQLLKQNPDMPNGRGVVMNMQNVDRTQAMSPPHTPGHSLPQHSMTQQQRQDLNAAAYSQANNAPSVHAGLSVDHAKVMHSEQITPSHTPSMHEPQRGMEM